MFPHTSLTRLAAVGALLLTAACGAPPEPPPKAVPVPSAEVPGALPASAAPVPSLVPTPFTPSISPVPLPLPPMSTPTLPPAVTTSPPTAPVPSRAARCTGEPTGAQILALVDGRPGVPDKPLKVQDGPYCSGQWSYTTVELVGATPEQLEPLMVVTVGTGSARAVVAAGTDVCNPEVQSSAPPGVRVLACGF